MPVIMTVMFFLGVHFVPPDADSFTIRTDQAMIGFSKLEDGGWKAVLDSESRWVRGELKKRA